MKLIDVKVIIFKKHASHKTEQYSTSLAKVSSDQHKSFQIVIPLTDNKQVCSGLLILLVIGKYDSRH